MTAIKNSDVDRFIAKPDPAMPIVLVYGPDAGLVRERVDALVRASVDDPNDPFAFVRIEGEELSANPSRLVEEANTIPLFGGRRAVLLRVNPRYNAAPALTPLIEAPSPDCRVIIEAGELRKTAPLRTMCEKAKTAAALPCYLDDAKAISSLIDEEMRAAKLTLTPDARAALTSLLGGDRLASRGELRKLAVYAMGRERIELDDVMAVVADASEQALDGVIDAAFAGETRDVETEFGKARAGGSSPAAIVSAAIRQVANLHKMKLAVDGGDFDRVRHDARRAAGAFHAQERRRSRAAGVDAGTPAARHGAARRGLARGAPQRRPGRDHRAAHTAVDRGERAKAGELSHNAFPASC